jgi:hypothetical protein
MRKNKRNKRRMKEPGLWIELPPNDITEDSVGIIFDFPRVTVLLRAEAEAN